MPLKLPAILFLLCFTCFARAGAAYRTDTIPFGKTGSVQTGTASWYSDKFNGRKTANGEIFSQTKFTAAHNKLPFGTWVKVTNLRNKKWVYVKINDRLHYRNKRVIDLSRVAAAKLGMLTSGLARVEVEVMGRKKPAD
ncbi:MAG: septal ring lytic transglycosylase RlpA family protein [Chitinophagaceae bacterium]